MVYFVNLLYTSLIIGSNAVVFWLEFKVDFISIV